MTDPNFLPTTSDELARKCLILQSKPTAWLVGFIEDRERMIAEAYGQLTVEAPPSLFALELND